MADGSILAGRGLEGLREAVQSWCREEGVRLCVLFGSRATGKARPGSDVDLAVWPATPGAAPSGAERLEWHLGLQRRVDGVLGSAELNLVVVTPELDPVLGGEIFRDGRVLFEAEQNLWFWQRLRLWQLYQDARPFLQRQREELHRYAEEVRRRGA